MEFSQLKLDRSLLRAVAEAGYVNPSPIQKKAIPPVLAGRDLLGCAQTGTGKTAAFALPILQRLTAEKPGKRYIRALVLTPTRELALQIFENFEQYGKYLKLRSAVIFGGVGQAPQVATLKKGVDILVATPGRLNDLIGQGFIDLSHLEVFVLDEADRMLDMGFVHDVRKVIAKLPEKRQTLLFSATLPKEIQQLANSLLHDPAKVFVTPVSSTVESIEQSVYKVDKANKRKLLAQLLQGGGVTSALVFTRTKHGADRVARDLNRANIPAAAIHGNKSQGARQDALARFKAGKVKALVATDIAARGIDIHELSHVINFDLPNVPETYVHRIGRTGRAGHEGIAISFCDGAEEEYLTDIEKLIGFKIHEVTGHDWPATGEAPAPAQPQNGRQQAAQKKQPKKQDKNAGKNPQKNTQKSQQQAPAKAEKGEAKPPVPKTEKMANKRQPAGKKQRGPRKPLPPFDPYENLKGGSAIVTKKPVWASEPGTPAGVPAPEKGEDTDMSSRNRRRGGKNRGKKNQGAKPAADKPAAPVIPKNPGGVFDFTEEELAEDTSLKVISRRENTEQKYASFEDFLKDN